MNSKVKIFLIISFFSMPLAAIETDPIPSVNCELFDVSTADQRTPGKINYRNGKDMLQDFKFKFDVVGYGPNGKEVEVVEEVPNVVLPVPGGWLLGSDRGEWGGNLVFRSAGSEDIKIIDDNIEDIYIFPFGYVVTAGLTHMGMDRGSIYVVFKSGKGSYEAVMLHALISAPKTSWLTSSGDLLINMWDGNSALLKNNGSLERLHCMNIERKS